MPSQAQVLREYKLVVVGGGGQRTPAPFPGHSVAHVFRQVSESLL